MSYILHRPETIEEASALELSLGDGACFIAGGTDLVIQMTRRQKQPEHVIDLTRIPGMADVEFAGGNVTIGALATHKAIWLDRRLAGPLEAIREAAVVVGGHQVRNIATIGGNVANASPAADVVAPLAALDGLVILRGPDEQRTVKISDFLLGPRRTARLTGEIITGLRFSVPPAGSATAFVKAGRRKAMEIAVVNVAAFLQVDEDGTCLDARIALGSVGPTILRARSAETMMRGRHLGAAAFRDAGQEAMKECTPISDVRASAQYRSLLVAALVERALAISAERISTARATASRSSLQAATA